MTVRAKFQVVSKTEREGGFEVNLQPVTGGSDENKTFFKYTPYGSVSMGLVSRETADQFTVGNEYYIDFKKA